MTTLRIARTEPATHDGVEHYAEMVLSGLFDGYSVTIRCHIEGSKQFSPLRELEFSKRWIADDSFNLYCRCLNMREVGP